MDPGRPLSQQPTVDEPKAEAGGVSSSKSGSNGGGSQSSQESPTLSPSQYAPLTNSLISNLDLGEEDSREGRRRSGTSNHETLQGSSSFSDENDSSTGSMSNGRAVPLAPRDVLAQPRSYPTSTQASSSFPTSSTLPSLASSHVQEGSNNSATMGADDSALDALVEAHQKQDSNPYGSAESQTTPPQRATGDHRPDAQDASFGLDPDADTSHSLQGTPFRLATSTTAGSSASRPHSHDHHSSATTHGGRHLYGRGEENAASHSTAATGAPETMKMGTHHAHTVPTASATGMPRFLPRRTSQSGSSSGSLHSSHSSNAPAPKEMQLNYAPSGSLTLAIFGTRITWRRRGYLLLASLAINLGLPFINGVMLGFGEIFARTIVAPWIGLTPGAININAPGSRAASTGGAGLRYAADVGGSRGSPGKVSVESWEVEPGQRGRSKGGL